MNAVYGIPHAFAWNIGTITRTLSRSEAPTQFVVIPAIECRYVDRWL